MGLTGRDRRWVVRHLTTIKEQERALDAEERLKRRLKEEEEYRKCVAKLKKEKEERERR